LHNQSTLTQNVLKLSYVKVIWVYNNGIKTKGDKMISAKIMTEKEARSYIGVKYEVQGKRKDIYTVTEVYSIYNSKNELVSFMFQSEHTFLGQNLVNSDIALSSIKRGIIKESHES